MKLGNDIENYNEFKSRDEFRENTVKKSHIFAKSMNFSVF